MNECKDFHSYRCCVYASHWYTMGAKNSCYSFILSTVNSVNIEISLIKFYAFDSIFLGFYLQLNYIWFAKGLCIRYSTIEKLSILIYFAALFNLISTFPLLYMPSARFSLSSVTFHFEIRFQLTIWSALDTVTVRPDQEFSLALNDFTLFEMLKTVKITILI